MERDRVDYAAGDGTAYDPTQFESEEDQYNYEQSVYTPRELEQLGKFAHLEKVIHESEEILDNGQTNVLYWIWKNDDGTEKSRKEILRITPQNLFKLKEMAFRMYAGNPKEHIAGFKDDEKMKEAADNILNGYWVEKQTAAEFEKREMAIWWDQS